MATLQPVDYDPFAQQGSGVVRADAPAGITRVTVGGPQTPNLIPVDHDPFASTGTLGDVGSSALSGLASGATKLAGLIPDLSSLAHNAANKYLFDPLLNATIGPPSATADQPPVDINQLAGSANIQKGVESLTGPFYKPQTTAGKFAHNVGEMIPGSLLAPGSLLSRLASGVGAGLGGEAAGQLSSGTRVEPYARIAGALAGGMAPSALGHAITPIPASQARQRLVDVLRDEGVTSLTAGQRTGNKSLQYLESASSSAPMAGAGAERIQTEGQRQFTEAAMRRAGTGPDATPEVLATNNARLGNEFARLSARNTMVPDNQFITDITAAVRNYRRVPDSQQRQMVQGYIDDIIDHVNAGQMPGAQYQEMRSRLSRQANSLRNSDPTLSEALRDMRNALDNAMNRSIAPADREAWQAARRQYGAQKTLEKAASRAGEATAEGQIVPANLRNTVAANNRGAYARGEGDFSELSRAGSAVMSPLPNSGTAQRHNAFSLLNQATLGAIPALTGRALMSRPAQAYLGNQLLAPALNANPTSQQAIFQALMEASRLRLSNDSKKR